MTVIKIENLGKRYILPEGQQKERYHTFRDMLKNSALHAWKRAQGKAEVKKNQEFWALRNISFEVKQGERLGIIGRNGAGKSTLLKLLSRITEPTEGRITMRGRVGSLLEVGTGFHPELTGRENIFLNGAVLGMSHREIRQRFDEIVSFAEVEKFLDTPVKRYSSGMYVRLAFAVAAHLEPEVLIVDEVLAVGDAQFQKKCLGKLERFGKEGRTVIFVSHQMAAIKQMCSRALVLDKGEVTSTNDDVSMCIHQYLEDKNANHASRWENKGDKYKHPEFTPDALWIGTENGGSLSMPVANDQDFWIHVTGTIEKPDHNLVIGYTVLNEYGETLYYSTTIDTAGEEFPVLSGRKIHIKSKFPKRFLNEGEYTIQLWVYLHGVGNLIGCGVFYDPPSVVLNIQDGLSDSPFWTTRRPGFMAPMLDWVRHE